MQSDPRVTAYSPSDPVVSKDGSYAIVPYGDEAQAQSGGRRAARNAPPPPPHYSGSSFDSGALNLIQMSTSTTERLVRHMEAKIDKIYANVESGRTFSVIQMRRLILLQLMETLSSSNCRLH